MAASSRTVHAPDSSIQLLDPLMDAWHGIMTRYGELWQWRDVPYWYNERASVSTLAAAVWLSGGVALEEFRTEKGEMDRIQEKNYISSKGRGDLYFHYSGAHFMAEAKQHWAYPGRILKRTLEKTDALLNYACDDVRAKRADDDPTGASQRRLGMVFAVPCFPATERLTWEALTETWLSRIIADIPTACISWYRVPSESIPVDNKGWLYPGVCLLLRVIN